MMANGIFPWKGSMTDLKEIDQLLSRNTPGFSDKEMSIDLSLIAAFLSDTRKVLTFEFLPVADQSISRIDLLQKIDDSLSQLLLQSGFSDWQAKKDSFLQSLPELHRLLLGSIQAISDGDPASDSFSEIVLCYPGFYAITNYRIAHQLYALGLKFIARFLSEEAHHTTGIDINPGAQIGENFFIDHGTGIVIGETTIIGNQVKLYQGVTLGALSLKKGRLLRGLKRHPTVQDNVTIYSNAAIFGGETIIGEDSTVGANVYLTHSIPPHSIIYLGNSGIKIIPKVAQENVNEKA